MSQVSTMSDHSDICLTPIRLAKVRPKLSDTSAYCGQTTTDTKNGYRSNGHSRSLLPINVFCKKTNSSLLHEVTKPARPRNSQRCTRSASVVERSTKPQPNDYSDLVFGFTGFSNEERNILSKKLRVCGSIKTAHMNPEKITTLIVKDDSVDPRLMFALISSRFDVYSR